VNNSTCAHPFGNQTWFFAQRKCGHYWQLT
jgi:hypothetical protein